MGGDLNLKKSWHTGLLSNQRRVWEAEQQAISERKKIEQVRREREEERQIEEIAKLAEAHGSTKRRQRVEWMYGGPTVGGSGTVEEQEAYLLGKRRVDNLLKKDDVRDVEKAVATPVDSARDISAKVALDPLLLIEKQRQETLEKAMAVEVNIQKRKHHHQKDKGRSEPRTRHGHRRISRSDRSRSPTRHWSRERNSDHERQRGQPPRKRSRSRQRSRSPGRTERHPRHQGDTEQRRPRSFRSRNLHDKFGSTERIANMTDPGNTTEDNRAARLAEMQSDASSLEAGRLHRLAAFEAQDVQEREREERKRGRGTNFKATLYQQAESVGLEGRLKRSKDLLSL
jgi:Pre-mRNA splicing factor/N-terminal domain of CBF1 interacting co-repressor CIR